MLISNPVLLHYVIVLPGEKQNGMHFPQYVSVRNSWPLFFFLSFFCNQIGMRLTTIGAAESHNPPATPRFFPPLTFRSLGMIGKLQRLLAYPDLMGVHEAS